MIKKTFDPINTIRVIALLMVYFLHSLLLDGKDFPMNQILEYYPLAFILFTPAWGGVWIFFLISGYLAGVNFANGKYKLNREGIWKYYKRKISNIYIPTILFIGFCVVMVEPSFFSYENVWLKMLTCTYNGIPGFPGVGATWFVFTLMWLYAIAPIVAKIIRNYNNKGLLCIEGGLILLGIFLRVYGYYNHLDWYKYIYTAPWANLDIFFSGMIFAYWQKCTENKIKTHPSIIIVMFVMFVLINCYMIAYNKQMGLYQYIFPTIYILISIVYLQSLANAHYEKEKLLFKGINWFSGISFEFYLFHSLIMGRVVQHVGGHTPLEQYVKYITVVTIVTLIFSVGYHSVISKNKGA